MVTILLSTIISVACSNKFPKEAKECEVRLTKCYEDTLKEDWVKKYEKEYRKAVVLQNCRELNGATK